MPALGAAAAARAPLSCFHFPILVDSPGEAAVDPARYRRGNLLQTGRRAKPSKPRVASFRWETTWQRGAAPSEAAVWELDVCSDGGSW